MRYKNAQNIFPTEILTLLQNFVDGEYIYIPRKSENRKNWGERTNAKIELGMRNEIIYSQYKAGKKIGTLALEHFLSEKSIQRIVTQGKKMDQPAPWQ